MKILCFNTIKDLSCAVKEVFDDLNNDEKDVAIIAKYEEARKIITELAKLGCEIKNITLEDSLCNGYENEFIISLCSIDEEYEIWCEQMLRDNGYLNDDSTVTYILDNCSAKVINHCFGDIVYEVSIKNDDEEYCECTCRKEKTVDNTSKESYSINGQPVSKKEFLKVEDEFNKELRDSLLSWSKIMNSMNEMRKVFRW